MITSGDLLELAIDHSELGSRIFEAKSGEDVTIRKGGYMSNDDDSNHGANLTRIDQKNAFPWSMEVTILSKPGDFDHLQALQQSAVEGNISATFMDGTVRVGTGKPVGELAENKQAGTIGFKVAGSNTFEEI